MAAAEDSAARVPFPRLKRAFRSGIVSSRNGGEYRPFVTIGLARDGGVFAAPAAVDDGGWLHGPLRSGVSQLLPGTQVTSERPKLHYHRSGVVRATLSGQSLPAYTSNFPRLHERAATTFMSVVVTCPGEFPVCDFRKGDEATVEGGWPTVTGLAIAVVAHHMRSALIEEELSPMGLVAETPSQMVVELSGYGHSLLLLSQSSSSFDELPEGMGPSVTVAAYDEPEAGSAPRIHGLWSTTARNPMLHYVDNFVWEADRTSDDYRDSYIRRFARLPPWDPDSETQAEKAIVDETLRTPRPPGEELRTF